MFNKQDKLCITGYHKLGNLNKATLIESEGYMFNEQDKLCITGYHKLGNLTKAALIESEGYMLNEQDKLCIKGYNDLGNLAKGLPIESGAYIFNEQDKLCITGYHELGTLGGAAHTKIHAAAALGEHHTHVCISALCHRGASVKWEKGYPVGFHLCYDPQQSGLAGQPPRQKKGLKLHMCKKCHRTAQNCKGGASCRAPACSHTSRKSCQHLH